MIWLLGKPLFDEGYTATVTVKGKARQVCIICGGVMEESDYDNYASVRVQRKKPGDNKSYWKGLIHWACVGICDGWNGWMVDQPGQPDTAGNIVLDYTSRLR